MKLWSKYHIPTSVEEALALLASYQGQARLVAGGTDLLIEMQQASHVLTTLIDVTKIPELRVQELDGDSLILGAGVTHSQIVQNPILQSRATCLVESCGVVGGPQVRNVATIGGNVAHALPAADGTISLITLGAKAEVASSEGRRWHDLPELFLGAGESLVDSTRQMITRFRIPLTRLREASAFERIMRPQGVALPVLGCAARVRLDDQGRFEEVSLCLAPVAPTPIRAEAVEKWLVGRPAQEASILEGARLARQTLHPRTSKYRATAAYREEMIELLTRRSLSAALERAEGSVL